MFGTVVLNLADEPFEAVLARQRAAKGVANDADLDAGTLRDITAEFKAIVKARTKRAFPEDPREQLRLATEAVFRSWNGKRAIDYRNAAGIAHDLGTAVNIQTMVFATWRRLRHGRSHHAQRHHGRAALEGDWLTNAQGEDVVRARRDQPSRR